MLLPEETPFILWSSHCSLLYIYCIQILALWDFIFFSFHTNAYLNYVWTLYTSKTPCGFSRMKKLCWAQPANNLSKVTWLNHDLNWGQLDSEAANFILTFPLCWCSLRRALLASPWTEGGLLFWGRGKTEHKCCTFANWSPYQKLMKLHFLIVFWLCFLSTPVIVEHNPGIHLCLDIPDLKLNMSILISILLVSRCSSVYQ